MGYPMTYSRVVHRNHLTGGYSRGTGMTVTADMVAGDLRRLEKDTQDEHHVRAYAELVGTDEETVRRLFAAFFADYPSKLAGLASNRASRLAWLAEKERETIPEGMTEPVSWPSDDGNGASAQTEEK